MKAKNTVFVGILNGDKIIVSTTLKGLCRLMGLKYGNISKAWQRWSGAGGEYRVDDVKEIGGCEMNGVKAEKTWRILETELDTTLRRGNPDFGKKIKSVAAGFRGMKGVDGRLHSEAEMEAKAFIEGKQKKRTLADDTAMTRGISETGEDYEFD